MGSLLICFSKCLRVYCFSSSGLHNIFFGMLYKELHISGLFILHGGRSFFGKIILKSLRWLASSNRLALIGKDGAILIFLKQLVSKNFSFTGEVPDFRFKALHIVVTSNLKERGIFPLSTKREFEGEDRNAHIESLIPKW